MHEIEIEHSRLELIEGDITSLDVDAIVNPANTDLVLGAGVAGAIGRAGGPTIQEACTRLAPIRVGEAVMTHAGALTTRHVIHAVGPCMGEGDEDMKFAQATRSALAVAERGGVRTVALPAISTGVFGYPIERCADIMLGTIIAFLSVRSTLERVVVCLFDQAAHDVFVAELERFRPASVGPASDVHGD